MVETRKKISPTLKDRQVYDVIKNLIALRQAETQKWIYANQQNYDQVLTTSPWQSLYGLMELSRTLRNPLYPQGITFNRFFRLIDLGWLEQRPTDGFGPDIKIAVRGQ